MLTALSVARDCDMIHTDGQVVLVHVSPPRDGEPARVEWTRAEDLRDKTIDAKLNDVSPTKVIFVIFCSHLHVFCY